MRVWLTFLLWLVNGLVAAEQPGDFAFGLPIETRGAQALFEFELPPVVHEGVTRSDLGDLRVFNAAGEPVPHAFRPRTDAARTPGQPLRRPFFALRGDAAAGVEGVELRVERGTGKTVFTMNAAPDKPARRSTLLGYLIDASRVETALQALTLELPTASGDLVTRLRVEASDDLARWTTLVADAPVVSLTAGEQRLERLRVEFPAHRARYFRLSWPPAGRPLELSGLTLEPGAAISEAPRRWRQVAGQAAAAGEYVFDLGGQFPVDRLRLVLPQSNSVVAVDFLARARAGDAWRRVAVGTVYRLTPDGQEVTSPEIAIPSTSDRYWLLRVDQRGGGIGSGRPELAVGWLPQRLVFAARGAPPFLLAYGRAGTAPATYPLATLIPGYRVEDDGKPLPIPVGRATTGVVSTLAGHSAYREPPDWRRWTLWASLLLGVALLGWMALRLGRQLGAAKPQTTESGPGES
ncbi:DUF3999 domain-containing protein [Accumulibacter sp.]|uniref:DUF3999 domain-containing protein n=1 Tax=Accumulibacter sp. TaxID=2053492 RepID=UPI002613EB2F|nr:DUF3999 domain-containing protein [Accumulibacter sp.]